MVYNGEIILGTSVQAAVEVRKASEKRKAFLSRHYTLVTSYT
jgi:hypothetical protein